MAQKYSTHPPRSSRAPSGYQAAPPNSSRGPVYRELPTERVTTDNDARDDDDAPDSFWGHYVEDRLRHFAQESR